MISFFHRFSFLESWVGRGLFLILCGSVMLVIEEHRRQGWQVSACSIIAAALGISGILYFSMGLLCFRELKMREMTIIRRKKQVQLQVL